MRWILAGVVMLALAIGIERSTQGAAVTPDQVTALIYEAAAYYGTSGDWLYATAMCETGGTLRNDLIGRRGERGVFQWLAWGQWWSTPMGIAGHPIPINDLWADIYMAAWSFANGYAHAWSCA